MAIYENKLIFFGTQDYLKTGSINTLKSKGIVSTDGKREFVADIVYDGEVIGHKTYSDTVYKLVA